MWFLWSLLAALAAASVAAIEEDVLLRAEAAALACTAPGGAPHPWDPQLLVLCADAREPLTVVHCPPGTRASNASRGCQLQEGEDDILHPHRRRLRREGPADVSRICKDGAGIYCDGCDSQIVCAVSGDQLKIIANSTCSSFGDKSCDPTTRSCKTGSACSSGGSSGFRCLVPGIFPDPEDCTRFHLCDDNLQDFSDTCELGYDAASEGCISEKSKEKIKDCGLPGKCTADESAAKPIGELSSFYRICVTRSQTGYTTSVMRCPGAQFFDTAKGACTYKCPGTTNRYADPINCHNYYGCVGTGADAKLELKSCPKGYAFDSQKMLCAQEATVKSCSIPTTSTTTTTPSPVAPQIPPIAPPPATTKAPPKTTSPGDCTQEGPMADPSSSSRYFVCTSTSNGYVKRVEYCPTFATYNRAYKYCTFLFG